MKLAILNNEPEIFYTIQGEGVSLGTPAIFVRLSLCNLHCVWCDTPYTWNWEDTKFKHLDDKKYNKASNIVTVGIDEIVDDISESHCELVVFTGGEPLLQQKELVQLFTILRGLGHKIEVETNGTIVPSAELARLVTRFNVSPKLANSGNSLKLRNRESAMSDLAGRLNTIFKFVIATEDDLQEVKALIDQYEIDPDVVYLMPEGRTDEEIRAKSIWLVDVCKQYQYKFSTRLHVLIWGAKQGV